MAKKNNDDIENNDDLNDQNQSDFNEADDNFGLPDVEYTPLDETSEESENSDDSSTSSDEYSYSSDTDSEESQDSYETEETEVTAYASDEYSNTDDEDKSQEYIPGSYTPPVEENSNVGKIIGIILFAVIVSVGAWYFAYYRPAQKEKARIELEAKQKAEAERIAKEKKAEEERRAREAAEAEAARLAAAEAAKPKIGTIETISARTGRFYCVVASAIDGDLAMDYANKLIKKGTSVTLIPPFGKSKFHRVTVDNLDSWAAAENRATELKNEFGEDVWVIKY